MSEDSHVKWRQLVNAYCTHARMHARTHTLQWGQSSAALSTGECVGWCCCDMRLVQRLVLLRHETGVKVSVVAT